MVGDDSLNSNLLVISLYAMRPLVGKEIDESTHLMVALIYSSEAAFANFVDNDIRAQLLLANHPSRGRVARRGTRGQLCLLHPQRIWWNDRGAVMFQVLKSIAL